MSNKHLIVRECGESCPFRHYIGGPDGCFLDNYRNLPKSESFPEWCPLKSNNAVVRRGKHE